MSLKDFSKFLVVIAGMIGLAIMTVTFDLVIKDFYAGKKVDKVVAVNDNVLRPIPIMPLPIVGPLSDASVLVKDVKVDGLSVEVERLNNKPAFLVWNRDTIWSEIDTSKPIAIIPVGSKEKPEDNSVAIRPSDIKVGNRLNVSINGDFQVEAQQYLVNRVIRLE